MSKPQLPLDLVLYELLRRLPAKSAGRFRCVSKAWCSFLKTPKFAEIHFRHLLTRKNNTQCQKLLVISNSGSKPDFNTFDCKARPDGANHSDFPLGDAIDVWALGSCNGLVCMGLWYWRDKKPTMEDVVVWNPLTGDYKKLEFMPRLLTIGSYHDLWAFHYDERAKDYKILNVSDKDKVFMFALKTNSWREVDVINGALSCPPRQSGVVFNGSIHWMAKDDILRFDLSNENLKVEPLPIVEGGTGKFYKLTIHQEQLHTFLCNPLLNEVELWRMNKDKKEDWEKTATIPVAYGSKRSLFPLCFTSYGKLIVLRKTHEREVGHELCTYNLETRNVESKFQMAKYEIFCDVIEYTETLVSPNDIAS